MGKLWVQDGTDTTQVLPQLAWECYKDYLWWRCISLRWQGGRKQCQEALMPRLDFRSPASTSARRAPHSTSCSQSQAQVSVSGAAEVEVNAWIAFEVWQTGVQYSMRMRDWLFANCMRWEYHFDEAEPTPSLGVGRCWLLMKQNRRHPLGVGRCGSLTEEYWSYSCEITATSKPTQPNPTTEKVLSHWQHRLPKHQLQHLLHHLQHPPTLSIWFEETPAAATQKTPNSDHPPPTGVTTDTGEGETVEVKGRDSAEARLMKNPLSDQLRVLKLEGIVNCEWYVRHVQCWLDSRLWRIMLL